MMHTDTHRQNPSSGLPPELLLDYASGGAPEPVALAVATALELNPAHRDAYARLNALGGAMLDSLEDQAAVHESDIEALLARLEHEVQLTDDEPQQASAEVPLALQPYVGRSFADLHWRSLTGGVEEHVIATNVRGWRTSLLRIAPGKAMPLHRHGGDELTLVLEGSYTDCNGYFGAGDLEVAGPEDEHRPVADAVTGCLCLAVLSAPLRLSGFVGWFVNPFLKI
jgi:putative transcriptional regulator